MSRNKRYETIVIGTGIGGLFAAALMAKRGISILILKEKGYEPYLEKSGYRFVPFSNFTEKNLSKKLIELVFEELEISSSFSSIHLEESEKSKEVYYQVILPENRIDVLNNKEIFETELKREFKSEIKRILKFYDEIGDFRTILRNIKSTEVPAEFFPLRKYNPLRNWFLNIFFKRKDVRKRLVSFSEEFREFIKLQLISHGNLLSDQFSLLISTYILTRGVEGIDKSIDIERLKSKIINKYLDSGGEIEEIEKIKNIERRFKERFLINLSEEDRVLESKFLILNCPFRNILSFMKDEKGRIFKWKSLIRPYYVILPSFLGIQEKVVPVGMKDLIVSIFNPKRSYENGNLIYLSLSPKGNEEMAPRNKRALVVEYLIPFKNLNSRQKNYKKDLMTHLNHIIPFLEDYIDFIDFDWAEEQLSFWSYPHFIYGNAFNFDWRSGIIPNRFLKNLFFVGKENFPYLGLEGEIISGYITARQILNQLQFSKS